MGSSPCPCGVVIAQRGLILSFRLSVGFGFIWFVLVQLGDSETFDLSGKENLKFESAIILKFDQNLESEFLFQEIGIRIRNRTIIL